MAAGKWTVLLSAVMTGCAVGPNYHASDPEVPQSYGELGSKPGEPSGPEADAGHLRRWWTAFGDPTLDSLIDRALLSNRDLQTAISRVREARADRDVAAGSLIPEVDATAGYNRSRGSKNVILPLSALGGGSSSTSGTAGTAAPDALARASPQPRDESASGGAASAAQPAAGAQPGGPSSPFGEGGLPGVTTSLFQAGFDAVWEIDVFGGTRRAIEAADAQSAAALDGAYGIRVTLLAEVATTYLHLRTAQAREAIARRDVESQERTWRIDRDKFKEGLGDEVVVAQQATQTDLLESALPALVAEERIDQHALALMLGEDPDALSAELSPRRSLPPLPPEPPVGVPSDLLRRRPDIRQAERNLAAATAEVGVATAQLFPQFSITGSFGLDSSNLKQLPSLGSQYYSIAPGVSWPILDWFPLRAAIRAQDQRQVQAALAYRTVVGQALKDVADSLVRYESDRKRNAALVQGSAQADRARREAAQIYSSGLADELATLEAERSLHQAQDQLAQSEGDLQTDVVGLYKALGGGW
jgi:NodT family efflux transporter outer membrane factor (OMF) lipoprotein